MQDQEISGDLQEQDKNNECASCLSGLNILISVRAHLESPERCPPRINDGKQTVIVVVMNSTPTLTLSSALNAKHVTLLAAGQKAGSNELQLNTITHAAHVFFRQCANDTPMRPGRAGAHIKLYIQSHTGNTPIRPLVLSNNAVEARTRKHRLNSFNDTLKTLHN